MVTSYLVLILAIAAIFSFVVPKLVESIQTFALNLGGYLANVQGWYNDIIAYFHLDVEALDLSGLNDVLKNLFNYVLGFLSDLAPTCWSSPAASSPWWSPGCSPWYSPSICSPAGTPS